MLSSDDDLMAGPDPSPSSPPSSSSASSGYTVVKHPPTPGWEFPPAPAGCEPKFAVIRLGNTQHKVRDRSPLSGGVRAPLSPKPSTAVVCGGWLVASSRLLGGRS